MFLRIKLMLSAIVLFLLSGCVESTSTFESETSAIKQMAYEINYQFVQESKRLKSLTDKENRSSVRKYFVDDVFSYFNLAGELKYPGNWSEIPLKIGEEELKSIYNKSKLTSSIMVVSPQKGVLVYPKLNSAFQKIEKSHLSNIMKQVDEIKEKPSGKWVTVPHWFPIESNWLISCVVSMDDDYIQLNIPVQSIKKNYLDKASGYYFIMDPKGRLIASRENTESIIAVESEFEKPGNEIVEFPKSKNIYRSKNQQFREACRKILTDGERKVHFNWNGSDYMLLNAEITELKWQLVQVIKL
ncbi:MAG: hypothetical protein RI562_02230 [Salibacter sp.]|nr:hypothetical protein [Salibacter sp.]